jgi:hypothetical protein
LRRLLKFLHTIGAIGMMGAMACLLVVIMFAPSPTSASGQAGVIGAMAQIATWVFLPSLALTLIAGLLAIAVSPGYHDAGWVWAKAATGILIFEGGFLYVIGPMQAAAKTAGALAGRLDPASLARTSIAERNSLWMLLAVAAANVALGVWRPRLLPRSALE